MGSRAMRTCSKGAAGDLVRWWIVEQGGQSCSWVERQQLVHGVTDRATQGSSAGK